MSNKEKQGTKLTQLKIAVEITQAILNAGKRVVIWRHLKALQTTAKEANDCKRAVGTKKEELVKIYEWNSEIDGKIELAEHL